MDDVRVANFVHALVFICHSESDLPKSSLRITPILYNLRLNAIVNKLKFLYILLLPVPEFRDFIVRLFCACILLTLAPFLQSFLFVPAFVPRLRAMT